MNAARFAAAALALALEAWASASSGAAPDQAPVGEAPVGAVPGPAAPTIAFIAEAGLPMRLGFDQRRIGGLSGLAHRASDDRWFAVSDDKDDPRIYTITVAVVADPPDAGAPSTPSLRVAIEAVTNLPAPINDAESISISSLGEFAIGCERPYSVWRVRPRGADSPLGAFMRPVALPVSPAIERNTRVNRGFESVAFVHNASSGRVEIWAATESALEGDGPEATPRRGAVCRVIVWDAERGERLREHAYLTLPAPATLPFMPTYNSLAELAALPDGSLLALERSFSVRRGFDGTLRRITPGHAESDVAGRALDDNGAEFTALRTETIASLVALGATPAANYEGMALGPVLPDAAGGRLLLLVADDNFGSDGQPASRVLALRLGGL